MPSDLSIGKGLSNKVVIVTGATSGIGRATALLYDQVGANVVAVGRNKDRLESLNREFSRPNDHLLITADLAIASDIQEITNQAISRYGAIDVLAHIAAHLDRKPFLDLSEADWDYHMAVNLKSTFLLNQHVSQFMIDNQIKGNIVNFTSGSWQLGSLYGADAYAASKAGIVTFSRGLAKQLGPSGIRVNTISPGQINTPMQVAGNSAENVQAVAQLCPLGRIGEPEEIASVTVFITSEHGSFINGATINVSGGLLLY